MNPFRARVGATSSTKTAALGTFGACAVLLFAFAGCGRMATMVSPYQIDVQQGNVVTQEMLAKLKPGMTRSQVRFALGSPLIVDPFRNDRWDYVYTYQKQGKEIEHRRVVVLFDDDKLLRIEGDALPEDPVARSSKTRRTGASAESDATAAAAGEENPKKEPGFFGRMLDRLGF